ncbi:MAG: response regulator [Rhodospirillaceae bacterium]|nr:response regulator [Rhodospirillaceae bacterium]
MPRGIKDCRILLIEDERSIREIIKAFLEKLGVKEIEDCPSAEYAWEQLVGAKARIFDVIFLDLQLPGMGGRAFIKNLRALSHPRAKTIPIVVLTATNDPEVYKKLERYGITAYLIKPVSSGVLEGALEKALSGRVANARPIPTAPRDDF